MNKNIRKSVCSIVLLFCTIILFVRCNKEDAPAPVLENIDSNLAADPDFSLFKAAIAQAKLETFTKGPGPFTILAPTNAALNEVGLTTATLPTFDSITLTAVLLNHFQNLSRTSYEFPAGPNGAMASMAGFNNYSSKNVVTNTTYVNGATVTKADINCGNGVIHKINKVLAIPTIPIRTLLKSNPNFSLMDSAIARAGLTTSFAPAAGSATTVFAINNTNMIAAGYTSFTAIGALTPAQVTTLSNILRYHIVQSRNFSVAMKAGNLKTLFGTNILVGTGTTVTVKGISNPVPLNLVTTDIVASNGIIHEVDGMLKP
jgi:transforming growth factor-beta-induced protein